MTPEERYLANQKLVYHILKTRYPMFLHNEDIQQEARIGLWRACQTFDEERGTKFSSYAGMCIDNAIKIAFRRMRRQVPTVSLDALIKDQPEVDLTLKDMIGGDFNLDWCNYEAFVDCLTPRERRVCELKLLGYSQVQIGEMFGLKQPTISRLAISARKKLEANL